MVEVFLGVGGFLWKLMAASTGRGCGSFSFSWSMVGGSFYFRQPWNFPRTSVEVKFICTDYVVTYNMEVRGSFHGSKNTTKRNNVMDPIKHQPHQAAPPVAGVRHVSEKQRIKNI